MANKKINELNDKVIQGSDNLFIGDANGSLFKGSYNDLLVFFQANGIKIPDGKSKDGTITTGTAGGNVTKQLVGFEWFINSVKFAPLSSSFAFQLVPNATFSYAVLIQGNNLGQYSLKLSTPSAAIVIPAPDSGQIALQAFIISSSGSIANANIDLTSLALKSDLDLKANLASPTFTGTVSGITKAMVGLGNVQNTDLTAAVNLNTAKETNANHTGDATGATVLTISTNVVTNAKLAQVPTKTLKGRTSALTGNVEDLTVAQVRTDLSINNVDNTADANKPVSTAQQAALNLKINLTEKGAVNGIVPLDSGAKILSTYFPDSILGNLKFGGTYNGSVILASASFPELQGLNLPTTGYLGIYFITTTAFTRASVTYDIGDWVLHNGSNNYVKVDNTDAVTTVFGRLGNVLANSADYSAFYSALGHVHAIADVTGLQNELNAKLNLTGGTLTGALTINVDSFINGHRVGRGAGNISTNTAFGNISLNANTTGSNNTANGQSALQSNTTGVNNTANGRASLQSNTIGFSNTASGVNALSSNINGDSNTAAGVSALGSNTSGLKNTAFGSSALSANITGSDNTALGALAGGGITTGSGNTILGANVTGLAAALTNNIILASGGLIRASYDGTNWDFIGGASFSSTLFARGLAALGTYTFDGIPNTDVEPVTNTALTLGSGSAGKSLFTHGSAIFSGALTGTSANFSGNVSLGAIAPLEKLSIDTGNIRFNREAGVAGVPFGEIIAGFDNNNVGASISFLRGTPSNFASEGEIRFRTAVGNDKILRDRMTITKEGNVGIGTTNPNSLLHLNSTTQVLDRIRLTGQEYVQPNNTSIEGVSIRLGVNRSNERQIWFADSSNAINSTNAQIRMRLGSGTFASIDSISTDGNNVTPLSINSTGGNVGIGTSNPTEKLDVVGNGKFSGSVTASSYITSSDMRLKDLVAPYDYTQVANLNPITFQYKNGSDDLNHYGYSAQDVQEMMPHAVHANEDGFLSVNYTEVLVAKVKYLENKLSALELRLQALENSYNGNN